MIKVSVIMAVYNSARYVQEAVQSILSQTFGDFELIIVNDASTDASAEILRGFTDPRIRIITHTINQGAAISRNDAMKAARGEYIAVMDADDLSLPHRLDAQVKFLDGRPDIGLVGSGIYDNIDADGAVLYTSYLPGDNEAIQKTLLEKWCFVHPSIMFRRHAIDRVGYYRKEFEPAEDHDFILRVLDHYKAQNLSDKLLSYRINPKGLSVVGQLYINDLGDIAMRIARKRRAGHDEEMEREVANISDLKHSLRTSGGVSKVLHGWKNSLYASDRYYGFGCKNLYVGDFQLARRCFVRSVLNNCFFMKSWICLCLSFLPFAVIKKYRFMFRSSKQYYDELGLAGFKNNAA